MEATVPCDVEHLLSARFPVSFSLHMRNVVGITGNVIRKTHGYGACKGACQALYLHYPTRQVQLLILVYRQENRGSFV